MTSPDALPWVAFAAGALVAGAILGWALRRFGDLVWVAALGLTLAVAGLGLALASELGDAGAQALLVAILFLVGFLAVWGVRNGGLVPLAVPRDDEPLFNPGYAFRGARIGDPTGLDLIRLEAARQAPQGTASPATTPHTAVQLAPAAVPATPAASEAVVPKGIFVPVEPIAAPASPSPEQAPPPEPVEVTVVHEIAVVALPPDAEASPSSALADPVQQVSEPLVQAPPSPEAPALPAAAPAVAGESDHPGLRPPGYVAAQDGRPDNLKFIKGIGPLNETRLNGLGIWHFAQIAVWTPDHVRWVGSYLAFPGRIERERWIDQAKTLAAGGAPIAKRASRGPRPGAGAA